MVRLSAGAAASLAAHDLSVRARAGRVDGAEAASGRDHHRCTARLCSSKTSPRRAQNSARSGALRRSHGDSRAERVTSRSNRYAHRSCSGGGAATSRPMQDTRRIPCHSAVSKDRYPLQPSVVGPQATYGPLKTDSGAGGGLRALSRTPRAPQTGRARTALVATPAAPSQT